jgi:hypothetical protein
MKFKQERYSGFNQLSPFNFRKGVIDALVNKSKIENESQTYLSGYKFGLELLKPQGVK